VSEASEVLESTRLPQDLVRLARRIARVAGDESDESVLAVSLALSAVGNGSVLVDLTDPESALPVDEDDDVPALTWPDPAAWCLHVAMSPVASGHQAPLRLEGERLYLHRYWCAERRIADNLLARIEGVHGVPGHAPEADLDEVQQRAVDTVLANRLAILTGGPGTGKTYTIARILRAFEDPSGRLPAIALAAPTGKAAARMSLLSGRTAASSASSMPTSTIEVSSTITTS
jgi:exodeoxyribonuclease V alpha subunit